MNYVLVLALSISFPFVSPAQRHFTNGIAIQSGVYFGITDNLDDLPRKTLRELLADNLIESEKLSYYVVENRSGNAKPVLMHTDYPYDIRLLTTNGSNIALTRVGISNNPVVPSSRKRGTSSRWIDLNPGQEQAKFNSFPKIGDDTKIRDYFAVTNPGTYRLEVRVRLWYQTNQLLYPVLSHPVALRYTVKEKLESP